MNLIQTAKPTKEQKKDMEQLLAACKAKEPLSLAAPVEDDLEYNIFLLYDDNFLAAMAFLFFPGDGHCECCGFVEPSRRRKGLFTRLLDRCLDSVETFEKEQKCRLDFCFLVDENTPSAVAVMEAIGAEYWYSEHKMERTLTEKDRTLAATSLTIKKEEDNLYCALLGDQVIGTCAILPSEKEIYLYAFQICESFRGQGYGAEFLRGMLSILAGMGQKVSLQVAGTNYIARNLYKKTGFRTSESLSYYLL